MTNLRCYAICPSPRWGVDSPSKTCEASCPSDTYQDTSGTRRCLPCHSSCVTCSGGTISDCLTCGGALPYHQNPTVSAGQCLATCQAPYPYVDLTLSPPRCVLLCSGTQWGYPTCNSCEDDCPSPLFQYVDGTQRVCQNCHASCLTCSGQLDTNCRSCAPSSQYSFQDNPLPNFDGRCL